MPAAAKHRVRIFPAKAYSDLHTENDQHFTVERWRWSGWESVDRFRAALLYNTRRGVQVPLLSSHRPVDWVQYYFGISPPK